MLLGVSALALALVPQSNQGEARPPNIIIFLADDLGWADVSVHNPQAKTPTFERFTREGAELTQCYAFPLCTPSRAALLTGRSPAGFGMGFRPIRPWDPSGLPAGIPTLADRLQGQGYKTSLVGKWHLGHGTPMAHPNARGFDHFMGFLTGSIDHITHYSRDGGYDWQRNGNSLAQSGHSSSLIAQEAVAWINTLSPEQPFFLVVSFHAPHRPLQASTETIQGYKNINDPQRQTFLAMVEELDTAVGKIIDAADKAEKWDPSLALYLSDNGAARGWGGDNGILRGGKASTFEGGIRVPAAIRWPEAIPPGSRFSAPVSLMDISATLLAAGGAKPDPEADGKDLRAHWEGREPPPKAPLVFTACSPGSLNYALIQWPWKLVRRSLHKDGKTRNLLFHLERDPGEERNEAEARPDLSQSLSSALDAWLKAKRVTPLCADDKPPVGWRPPSDWTVQNRAKENSLFK